MTAAGVLQAARQAGIRLVTVESCTGGMVAAALTDIPGSSDVVEYGLVTYSNKSKIELAKVSPDTLNRFGAVAEETALEMARGALQIADVDLAVSITGIAGPGGSEHKPEGRVCFAVALSGRTSFAETVEFGALGRSEVRARARDHALRLILRALDPNASSPLC